MIPYGKQSLDTEEIQEVVRILQADFLTCGPEVEAFESEFAAHIGAKYAIAVGNATQALHLALRVAGIGHGDRVVTSPNTFLASANCAAFVGAIPDFCDIDPISYNLDPHKLERQWKPDTKAVVAVDYAGQPANMPEIWRVAKERGAIVIEDACHAIGGSFSHEGATWKVGAHPWADITTFSFHPVKTMTTGEGGMIVTNNEEYARRCKLLRSHGLERSQDRFVGLDHPDPQFAEKGMWYYEMQELGYNFRITDIQCALGRVQLRKLSRFIERRLEIVNMYNEAFTNQPWFKKPQLADWLDHASHEISWHLYTVQIDFNQLGKTRTEVMQELRNSGIGSQVLYIPVYLQPHYRKKYGYQADKCPVSEAYYLQSLSLPLYPAMSDVDVQQVIRGVKSIVNV